MYWLIENWFILVCFISVCLMIGIMIYKFLGLPTKEQIEKIKVWLLQAVVEAEKELGNGTGAIKLSKVYDMFIAKFPVTAKIITFEQFSKLVDVALDEMKEMLKTNKNVKRVIEDKSEK